MFEKFKEAGLKPKHLEKFLKVSRTTASIWYNGHGGPHHLIMYKVKPFLKAVEAALAAGEFPVPKQYKAAAANTYVHAMLRKHIIAQKTQKADN